MKLQLVTLAGKVMDDDVYEVMVSTRSGEIGILPGHERMVTLAVPGVVEVRRNKGDLETEAFAVNGGIVEVDPDRVRILVDEAEAAEEIVAAEAEAALKRAKEHRAAAKTQVEINEAEALINRQTVRLKVANLRRRHR